MRQLTADEFAKLRAQALYLSNPTIGQQYDEATAAIMNPSGKSEMYLPNGQGFTGMNVTQNPDGTYSAEDGQSGDDWKGFSRQFEDTWMDKLTEAGVKAFLATAMGNVAGGFMGGGAGVDPSGLDSMNSFDVGTRSVYDSMANSQLGQSSGLLGAGAEAGMTFTPEELGLDTLDSLTQSAITAGKPAADAAIAAQTAGAFTVPAASGGGLLDTVKNFALEHPNITKALVSGAGGLLGAASEPSGDLGGGGGSNIGPGGYQFDPARYQFTRNNFGRI
jgi:hypothetical protein